MKVMLARPRGFCAGVDRAIEIVMFALRRFGSPVYVRRQIVHNRHVVEALSARGAVFVNEVADVPPGAILVLSAHGVAPAVYSEARTRGVRVIDATCPLVTKVHGEALRFAREGRPVIIIGHRGHDEVTGTLGYSGASAYVVETIEDVARLELEVPPDPAVITQTTLAVDDTRAIAEALKLRYPGLAMPGREDICYATQNRQKAVTEIARQVQVVIVLGSPESSNSNRLREVAEHAGVPAYLIEDVSQIRDEWLDGVGVVGVTSGASTPDRLVAEVLDFLGVRHGGEVETIEVARESISFALPPALAWLQGGAEASGESVCNDLRGVIDGGC